MAVTAKIVDMAGVVVRTLADTNIDEVVEQRGGHGTDVRLRIPKRDPAGAAGQNADVKLLREVQVWRDGDANPVAWSVLVGEEAESRQADVSLTALGLGFYFSKRFLDAARANLLTNPGFETGVITPWYTGGGATAAVIGSPRRLGSNAVRLTNTVTGADAYLAQDFSFAGDPYLGTNVHFSAHCFVESFTGPALDARGILLAAFQAGVLKDFRTVPLDASTPLNAWNKLRIGTSEAPPIWVPPGVTYSFSASLLAPNGAVVWDAAQVVIPESVSGHNADLSTLFGQVMTFAQDTAKGKSGLNIATSTPASGIALPVKAWQYDAYTPSLAAVAELTDRTPGIDWSIAFTATTRTATAHPGRRGTDRSASVILTLGQNLAWYRHSGSGLECETSVAFYGDGDGPDREEGRAVDTAATGGLVLEGRYAAPPGTTIDQLGPMAADKLRLTKRPVRRISARVVRKAGDAVDYVALLRPDDIVKVVVNDGRTQINSNWSIERKTWRPRQENVLELELTEE